MPVTSPRSQSLSVVKVLRLKPHNIGRFAHTVYQDDLEEALLLRQRVREAEKGLVEKENYIAAALRSGAGVEEGIHSARFCTGRRKAFKVRAGVFSRLIIK